VSQAGLIPVMALAQQAGLGELAARHVRIGHRCGVNAPVKIVGRLVIDGLSPGLEQPVHLRQVRDRGAASAMPSPASTSAIQDSWSTRFSAPPDNTSSQVCQVH